VCNAVERYGFDVKARKPEIKEIASAVANELLPQPSPGPIAEMVAAEEKAGNE
jgi:hypothetical protein